MRRFGIFLLLAFSAACLAQDKSSAPGSKPPQPGAPPEVDQALRERVSKFLQAHVDGKYRQADLYVAEESKDIYFAAQKPRYLSFQIDKIAYSENFTKAAVTAKCELEIATQLGRFTMNVPQESFWKIENGQWFWFVDPTEVRTPFGAMQRGQQGSANPRGAASRPPAIPAKVTLEDLQNQVTINRSEIRFPYQPASETVVVRNRMPGVVILKVEAPETPGLEVKLESDRIAPKGTARVVLNYKPQPEMPQSVVVNVTVSPTNEVLPIKLVFDPAPAAKQ